jgi:hypothetical protein
MTIARSPADDLHIPARGARTTRVPYQQRCGSSRHGPGPMCTSPAPPRAHRAAMCISPLPSFSLQRTMCIYPKRSLVAAAEIGATPEATWVTYDTRCDDDKLYLEKHGLANPIAVQPASAGSSPQRSDRTGPPNEYTPSGEAKVPAYKSRATHCATARRATFAASEGPIRATNCQIRSRCGRVSPFLVLARG